MGSSGKACPQLNPEERPGTRAEEKTPLIWFAGPGDLLVQLEFTRVPEVAANPAQQRGAHPRLLCPQAEAWSQQLPPH